VRGFGAYPACNWSAVFFSWNFQVVRKKLECSKFRKSGYKRSINTRLEKKQTQIFERFFIFVCQALCSFAGQNKRRTSKKITT